ncbi:MAG: glycosyltransferase family A protein [Lachnospiraceae bacterium]|nr:glycosyltransferase family A protein [Lachnospiraceae bacterium]
MAKMFSIIVPIYKIREEYLCQCIESLINQTFKNIEIHLMDDGSPDHCGQICDEYAWKDNRIIVHHLKNGGLSYARNCGLEAATGEYIIFVDGDDWVNIDFCDNMNTILASDSSIDIICTCYCYAYKNGNIEVNNNSEIFNKKIMLDREKKEKLLMAALYLPQYLNADISNQAEYSITMWGKVFKQDFLMKNQLKCVQGISPFEDNIFYAQMLKAKPLVYFDNHISVYYRINEQSVTQRRLNHKYEIRNLSKTINALKKVVDEQYLMTLFSIMRIRQISENIFLNREISFKEKKKNIYCIKNDTEIKEQLQIIKMKRYYKHFYKSHRLFYELFSHKQWYLLYILFSLKKHCMMQRKMNHDGLVRFK